MSVGGVIALCAAAGLGLGIIIGVTTGVPLAPEAGLAVGAIVGWRLRRDSR